MKSFKMILLLGLLAAVLCAAGVASAQAYPTKPIHVIVGFGPGGVADLTCRVVAQKLSAQLGQQVLIENRPSAGGIIAADAVAKAAPDGYTVLLLSNGNAVSASLFKSLPYDTVADFAPVSTLGFFDIAMLTKGDSKWTSVKDVLAYAKANPGKLNIGTINIGSTQNLSAELFVSMTGISATIVPYKGSPTGSLRSEEMMCRSPSTCWRRSFHSTRAEWCGLSPLPRIGASRAFPIFQPLRRAVFPGIRHRPGTRLRLPPRRLARSSTG